MAKFPVSELSGKPVDLAPSPLRVVLFFTIDEKSIFQETVAEARSMDLDFVGVYLGTDLNEMRSFKKSNPDAKVYKTSTIKNFESFGVSDLPWVLFMENNEVKISSSLNEIGTPLISSLISKMPNSKALQRKTTANNKADKIEELEALAEANLEEINMLKKELEKRDELIGEILEKL